MIETLFFSIIIFTILILGIHSLQIASSSYGEYVYISRFSSVQGILRTTIINQTSCWNYTGKASSIIVSSSDGKRVTLQSFESENYFLESSSDYGKTWTKSLNYITTPSLNIINMELHSSGLACDSNCQYILVYVNIDSSSCLYLSSDFGRTLEQTSSPCLDYNGDIGMDTSGYYIAVAAFWTGIYVSQNRGISWTNNAPNSGTWCSTAVS